MFNFCHFDYYVPWCVPSWVYSDWDKLCFLDLVDYFFSHVKEVFNYFIISSNILGPFSLSSPSGTPCNASVGVLKVVPQVS